MQIKSVLYETVVHTMLTVSKLAVFFFSQAQNRLYATSAILSTTRGAETRSARTQSVSWTVT